MGNKVKRYTRIEMYVVYAILLTIAVLVFTIHIEHNSNTPENRLYITSLHNPIGVPDNYVKVYEDFELDRAFYLNIEQAGFTRDYDVVKVAGQPDLCEVVQQFDNYILVKPKDLTRVYAGMSGTLVYSRFGKVIGFVSELTEDGLLKIISCH